MPDQSVDSVSSSGTVCFQQSFSCSFVGTHNLSGLSQSYADPVGVTHHREAFFAVGVSWASWVEWAGRLPPSCAAIIRGISSSEAIQLRFVVF